MSSGAHDRYKQNLDNYNWLMDEILRHETLQAMHLGAILAKTLFPRYVLDIGCGPGVYLIPFRYYDVQIFGVDGASGSGKMLTPREWQQVDLRQPWRHERVALKNPDMPIRPFKFDLSLCIEVAEHIEPEYARVLVDTICANSRRCFFTAAYQMPNGSPQGGEGHFNLQSKSWWLTLFQEQGWGLSYLSEGVMRAVEADPVFNHCGWVKWNGMLLSEAEQGSE